MRLTIVPADRESSHVGGETAGMDRRLATARAAAIVATAALVPTIFFTASSHIFVALGTCEAALLAISTGYAVYLGIYRYPR